MVDNYNNKHLSKYTKIAESTPKL